MLERLRVDDRRRNATVGHGEHAPAGAASDVTEHFPGQPDHMRCGECCLVHGLAAADVDEVRGGLHQREVLGVEHVVGVRRQRKHADHEVRLTQQRLEVDELDRSPSCGGRVVSENAQPEWFGEDGNVTADAAKSDDPERATGETEADLIALPARCARAPAFRGDGARAQAARPSRRWPSAGGRRRARS